MFLDAWAWYVLGRRVGSGVESSQAMITELRTTYYLLLGCLVSAAAAVLRTTYHRSRKVWIRVWDRLIRTTADQKQVRYHAYHAYPVLIPYYLLLSTAQHLLLITDHSLLLSTHYMQLPTSYFLLPTLLLPTLLLPTACYLFLLSTADCRLNVSYSILPTSHYQLTTHYVPLST